MCSLASSWTTAPSAWSSLGTRTSPRAAVSSGAIPKGTEADFPWSAQPPSLNESFLPAEAHYQATAHSPVQAQGYPTQPLGRLPRLPKLTEGSWEKDPASVAHRGWAQETLDGWPGSSLLGSRVTRKCGSGAQTGSSVMMKPQCSYAFALSTESISRQHVSWLGGTPVTASMAFPALSALDFLQARDKDTAVGLRAWIRGLRKDAQPGNLLQVPPVPPRPVLLNLPNAAAFSI